MTLQHHLSTNRAQPNHVDTGEGCSSDPSANNLPRRRTILLVEDEPFVREATRGILENAGFEVLPAFDVQDAIKVYDEHHRSLDLVMTDMVLPGGTGQQLGHDLQQRSPELVVLITSGYGNPDFETEAPESKTYFIAKPYTRRTLVDKIEKILGARPLTRATQAG
jgi:two-component system cell cycle sensor histidine kinase/response regulator CckA